MKVYVENHSEGKGQEPLPPGHYYETRGYSVRVSVKTWENCTRIKGN